MTQLRRNIMIGAIAMSGVVFFLLTVMQVSPNVLGALIIGGFIIVSFFEIRMLLIGWFVAAPYFAATGVEGGENIASNITHNMFVPGMVVASLVMMVLKGKRILFGKEDVILLLFFVYAVVSSYFATGARYDDVRTFFLIYFLPWCLYLLAKNIRLDVQLLKAMAYASIFHLTVLFLLAAYEYQTGSSLYTKAHAWNDVGRGRIAGPFGSPIVFGVFVQVVFLFIFLGYKYSLVPRFVLWGSALLAGTLTILTFTRSVWLGAFVTFIYIMYRTGQRPGTKIFRIAAFVGTVVAIVLALVATSPDIQRRIAGEENANFRVVMAQSSLNMIADKPVTGWGAGTFDEFSDRYLFDARGVYIVEDTSHVTLLTILAELGIIGAALILAFVYINLRFNGMPFRNLPREDQVIVAVNIGCIIAFAINAFLIDMRFHTLAYSWFFLSLGFIRNIFIDNIKLNSDVTWT